MSEQDSPKNGRKKRRTIGDVIRMIIMLIALGVFIFSAYNLYNIWIEYKKGTDEYKAIVEEVSKDTKEEHVCPIDFAALLEKNPDTVAWIKFEKPSIINYPIVQGTDNDHYLKHTFEGQKNSSGSIFMDSVNAADFSDPNTFIYGHNMKNGSMFGKLREYKKQDFYQSNPYFYIYTKEGEVRKYQIFSAHVVDAHDDSYIKGYQAPEDYQAYLDRVKGLSAYDTEVEVTSEDSIVSLSTCTSRTERERFLVHGKLIKIF